MLITRLICAVYWLSLTTLLLVPDVLFGGRIPQVGTSVGVHFAAFALLALFSLAMLALSIKKFRVTLPDK